MSLVCRINSGAVGGLGKVWYENSVGVIFWWVPVGSKENGGEIWWFFVPQIEKLLETSVHQGGFKHWFILIWFNLDIENFRGRSGWKLIQNAFDPFGSRTWDWQTLVMHSKVWWNLLLPPLFSKLFYNRFQVVSIGFERKMLFRNLWQKLIITFGGWWWWCNCLTKKNCIIFATQQAHFSLCTAGSICHQGSGICT